MNTSPQIRFVFFGSSRLSVIVLDELKELGLIPAAIGTTPDKPQGRKLVMTPNVVKTWAIENSISCLDVAKLDDAAAAVLKEIPADVFIVASYGKIMPARILDIPARGSLNVHPSLLPKYRGPSPLPTAILDDAKATGVTIMQMDAEMDHGPIVAQKPVTVNEWPVYEDFEEMMAREGARLLAGILPDWIAEKITPHEQDHSAATYTRKYTKEDGLLDLSADPYQNFRKIQAFHEWPQAYYFVAHRGKDIRIKVTAASFQSGKLTIEKVIPEGGREMAYADFIQGYSHE